MTMDTGVVLDLDRFYSTESVQAWKQIIGEDLHYHFGYFRGTETLETGLKQTVRNYYPHIPPGSNVLDVGCGWGGPAQLLIAERECTVTGITCSTAQMNYCQSLGLHVWQQNLDQDSRRIPGDYDVIVSLEMISHIQDKLSLLHRLRSCGARLILSESCAADGYSGDRLTFGNSIVLCTVSELVCNLESAGWTIQSIKNRRVYSLRTILLWQQNFERVYGDSEPPGQLGVLRGLVDTALRSPRGWCQSFPLIDIVAN
ncbi:class I SAM-dependent methyltransferase [Leptothoe sp. ISB3NOV94-8A]